MNYIINKLKNLKDFIANIFFFIRNYKLIIFVYKFNFHYEPSEKKHKKIRKEKVCIVPKFFDEGIKVNKLII